MKKKYDYVSIISMLLLFVSLFISDYIHFKKTRISLPVSMSAKEYLGHLYVYILVLSVILFVFVLLKNESQMQNFFVGIMTNIYLIILVFLTAKAIAEQAQSGRFSFGVGFIIAILSLYSIILKTEQFVKNIWLKMLVGSFAWCVIVVLVVNGVLNSYSVMQEYIAQKAKFMDNVMAHLELSFSALIVAVIIGVPMGYLCYKNSKIDKITIVSLSITETMPQLALFAVIRIPFIYLTELFPVLKTWGIGGYGFAPAFTALFIYALYLIIHNVRAAFKSVDPLLLESAVAMGMKMREVFWRVQMPSAMPYIINGVRIALISTIVGASLSSFVGAASLGVYIVNGVNALAIDLQLLGIIPIFIITVIADLVMGKFIKRLLPNGGKIE